MSFRQLRITSNTSNKPYRSTGCREIIRLEIKVISIGCTYTQHVFWDTLYTIDGCKPVCRHAIQEVTKSFRFASNISSIEIFHLLDLWW